MSRMQRDKGNRGELEVAVAYRQHGFDLDRSPNSGGLRIKGDLHGDVPEHVEVKRQEVLRLPLWTAQAATDAGELPWVVCYRRSNEPWHAVTTLERHLRLVQSFRTLYDG